MLWLIGQPYGQELQRVFFGVGDTTMRCRAASGWPAVLLGALPLLVIPNGNFAVVTRGNDERVARTFLSVLPPAGQECPAHLDVKPFGVPTYT